MEYEESLPVIILHDGQGVSYDFYIVDVVSIDGFDHKYCILWPANVKTGEEEGYLVARCVEVEGGFTLEYIEDEDEFAEVVAILQATAQGDEGYVIERPDGVEDSSWQSEIVATVDEAPEATGPD